MALDQDTKQQLIKDFQIHENDTGSPEVQIALLTNRINYLNEHLKVHKRIIIPPRAVEDGWTTPSLVGLSTGQGFRTISCCGYPTWPAQIRAAVPALFNSPVSPRFNRYHPAP